MNNISINMTNHNKYYEIVYTSDTDNTTYGRITKYAIIDEGCFEFEHLPTFEKELESSNIVDQVEDLLKDYVLEHFNKYDIRESGSNIYSVIKEKAYDILCDCINDLYESYDFDEEFDVNDYAEKYYEDIDISCVDEIINDILNAPVTIEEKLADVGMSIKDFLFY